PESPAIPFPFWSTQNWYCVRPVKQASTVLPLASSVTTFPGAPVELGVAASEALIEPHARHGSGVTASTSGAIVAALVSVEVTRTSSTYQPSSHGMFPWPKKRFQVCVAPTSKEVASSRILMRLPAYF